MGRGLLYGTAVALGLGLLLPYWYPFMGAIASYLGSHSYVLGAGLVGGGSMAAYKRGEER